MGGRSSPPDVPGGLTANVLALSHGRRRRARPQYLVRSARSWTRSSAPMIWRRASSATPPPRSTAASSPNTVMIRTAAASASGGPTAGRRSSLWTIAPASAPRPTSVTSTSIPRRPASRACPARHLELLERAVRHVLPSERTEAILHGLVEAFAFFGCAPQAPNPLGFESPLSLSRFLAFKAILLLGLILPTELDELLLHICFQDVKLAVVLSVRSPHAVRVSDHELF